MGCHSVVQHLLAWHAYNSEFNSQHTYTNNSNNNNYGKYGILNEKYTFTKKIYIACVEEKTDMHGGKFHFKAFLKCVSINDDMLIQSYEEMRWRITKRHKYRADG